MGGFWGMHGTTMLSSYKAVSNSLLVIGENVSIKYGWVLINLLSGNPLLVSL